MMSNPISVPVAVTQDNVTLYVMVDTFADYTQSANIQNPLGQPLVVQGNGEGKRIGYWAIPVAKAGIYTFQILIQYNDGSGFKNSARVSFGSVNIETLHQTVVFSEDAGDNDQNDCFVTFMWFSNMK